MRFAALHWRKSDGVPLRRRAPYVFCRLVYNFPGLNLDRNKMMQSNDDILSALTDTRLARFMRNAGPEAKDEAALLDKMICSVLAAEGRVTNKSLILQLIRELESACSDKQADTLRRTLEIVVGHTPDD